MIDDEDRMLLNAWYAWRGGMGGRGPLPWCGGYLEQPALLMDAFSVLTTAHAKLNAPRQRKGRD